MRKHFLLSRSSLGLEVYAQTCVDNQSRHSVKRVIFLNRSERTHVNLQLIIAPNAVRLRSVFRFSLERLHQALCSTNWLHRLLRSFAPIAPGKNRANDRLLGSFAHHHQTDRGRTQDGSGRAPNEPPTLGAESVECPAISIDFSCVGYTEDLRE